MSHTVASDRDCAARVLWHNSRARNPSLSVLIHQMRTVVAGVALLAFASSGATILRSSKSLRAESVYQLSIRDVDCCGASVVAAWRNDVSNEELR